MYQTPEQLVALNKANLEVAMKFAGVALQGTERILDLQLKAAKTAFADSVENAKTIAAVKDLQQLAALKDSMAQPTLEKATAYAKSVYDVTTATQAEFGKLVEEQVSEFNKQVVTALDKMVKNAPAGSEVGIAAFKSGIAAVNSAYDNLSKVAKQFQDVTQSNIEAVAKQAVSGVKKAKKTA
ncbi:MAG: phasin family protein [Betaproteobacteria bacterium]|nr:phasin family protein [Betaproteobacteria bacterium]